MLESFADLGHVRLVVDGSNFLAVTVESLWHIEASSSSSAAVPRHRYAYLFT